MASGVSIVSLSMSSDNPQLSRNYCTALEFPNHLKCCSNAFASGWTIVIVERHGTVGRTVGIDMARGRTNSRRHRGYLSYDSVPHCFRGNTDIARTCTHLVSIRINVVCLRNRRLRQITLEPALTSNASCGGGVGQG